MLRSIKKKSENNKDIMLTLMCTTGIHACAIKYVFMLSATNTTHILAAFFCHVKIFVNCPKLLSPLTSLCFYITSTNHVAQL